MFRTPGALVNTYVPGVLPGRTPGTLVNTHVRDPRHDTRRHTHTPTTKKTKTIKTETTKCTSRSFFKIREKQLQKTSKHLHKLITNRSKMNPGAPPETHRARDLFLSTFLMIFEPKLTPKWSQKRSKKYVFFACFSDVVLLRFLSDK